MSSPRVSLRFLFAITAALFSGCLLAQTGQPQTYGTSATSYVHLLAIEFSAFFPSAPSQPAGPGFARYSPGCEGSCLIAPLHLPSGAQIVSIELDAVDSDASDWVAVTLEKCNKFVSTCSLHPAAGVGPGDCITEGFVCTGKSFSGGNIAQTADLSSENLIVDNTSTAYILGVTADESAENLSGVIVGYVLQVSPAPGTSDFNDVATSSPQFKFIEALYHAGITAGCGGGDYCPNNPVTRGQMAVFLAKALGLQWP